MHMMFSLFVLGYGMEYQALARESAPLPLPMPLRPPRTLTAASRSPPLRAGSPLPPTPPLAEYHVAHDKAEAAAAMECYKKHGGGGGHH